MRTHTKRIAAWVLLLAVIAAGILTASPIARAEEPKPVFTLVDNTCDPESNVELVVRIDSATDVGGIAGRITFDTNKFSYVEGSLQTFAAVFGSGLQVNYRADKSAVYFAWDSADGVSLSGKLFSVKLKALANSSGENKVKLIVSSFYKADAMLTNIPFETEDATITVADMSADAVDMISETKAAQEKSATVTEKLNALIAARKAYLADLTNTDKSQAAATALSALALELVDFSTNIANAEESYLKLKASERLGVQTEYAALIELKKLLSDCNREIEIFDAEKEANAFRAAHAGILAKTQMTVAIGDKAAVQAAMADYESENTSYATRIALNPEYMLLQKLLSRIEALESDDSDSIIKRITEETLPDFAKTYEGILAFTDADINEDNAFNDNIVKLVNEAKEALDIQMLLDKGFEYLYEPYYNKIMSIKNGLDKLAGRSEKYPNVTRFNRDFRELKKKTVDSITLDDRDEIMQADYLIGMMSDDERKELGQAVVNRIWDMVMRIGELEMLEDDVVVEDNVIIVEGETVYIPGQNVYQINQEKDGEKFLSLSTYDFSIIKTAILCTSITLAVFLVCFGICMILLKNAKRKGEAIG